MDKQQQRAGGTTRELLVKRPGRETNEFHLLITALPLLSPSVSFLSSGSSQHCHSVLSTVSAVPFLSPVINLDALGRAVVEASKQAIVSSFGESTASRIFFAQISR